MMSWLEYESGETCMSTEPLLVGGSIQLRGRNSDFHIFSEFVSHKFPLMHTVRSKLHVINSNTTSLECKRFYTWPTYLQGKGYIKEMYWKLSGLHVSVCVSNAYAKKVIPFLKWII